VIEAVIQRAVLARINALTNRAGDRLVWAWRQNVGKVQVAGRWIVFGLPGQADVTGMILGGYRLDVELKSTGKKQSPQQVVFGDRAHRMGSIYICADSIEIAMDAVKVELVRLGHEL